MKKIFLLLCIAFTFGLINLAQAKTVDMQYGGEDPTYSQGEMPRGPVIIPSVSIDGYTLSLDHSCLGCTLRLVDGNDNVVYTTVINGDTLVLPSTLSGEYELQILFDDCYFFGFVEF